MIDFEKQMLDELLGVSKKTVDTINKIKQLKKELEEKSKQSKEDIGWEVVEYRVENDWGQGEGVLPKATQWISKVKRLSDSEVFSIDDEIEDYGVIKEIVIRCDYVCGLKLGFGGSRGVSIYSAKKVTKPKPLFVTGGDGGDVYEGDVFYSVTDDFDIVSSNAVKGMRLTDGIIRRSYYTRKAAEEYILLNKKLFSVAELVEIADDRNIANEKMAMVLRAQKLAKEKLSK